MLLLALVAEIATSQRFFKKKDIGHAFKSLSSNLKRVKKVRNLSKKGLTNNQKCDNIPLVVAST